MPGGSAFDTRSGYGAHSNFAGQVAAGVAIQPYGIARIIPSHPNGQQIDAIHASVDFDVTAVSFGLRVMTIIAPAISIVSVSNFLDGVGADPGELDSTVSPFVHNYTNDDVFPQNQVILDANTTGYGGAGGAQSGGELHLVFSARPGAGLLVPPGYAALVLVTNNFSNNAGFSNTGVMHFLTVCGGPLAPGQFEQASNAKMTGADIASTLARFGNVLVPPVKSPTT